VLIEICGYLAPTANARTQRQQRAQNSNCRRLRNVLIAEQTGKSFGAPSEGPEGPISGKGSFPLLQLTFTSLQGKTERQRNRVALGWALRACHESIAVRTSVGTDLRVKA